MLAFLFLNVQKSFVAVDAEAAITSAVELALSLIVERETPDAKKERLAAVRDRYQNQSS